MNKSVTARCPRCDLASRIPRPAQAAIDRGSELDGRPLTATPEVVATWQWTCSGCGLLSPSAEAARLTLDGGDARGAADLALQAAWIADDHDPDSAPECREFAEWLTRRGGGQHALRADLHRRNGDFDAAIAAARRVVASAEDPDLVSLAVHQLQLAHAGDAGRHSMVALFECLLAEAG
jgi:hypothetical protein